MVVVGSRGNGRLSRAVLGSVSAGWCHHAYCPVVVVHGTLEAGAMQRPILLGVDGSPASEAAIGFAFDEAARRGVGVRALHAWSDVGANTIFGPDWHEFRDDGEELLVERLASWQAQYPDVPVERWIVCDNPAKWLIDEAGEAQLVVVGSHGRGGFAGMLLGSVSTAVAESCDVSVVVVRQS